MPVSFPTFSLLYALLLLVPGFLTYKITRLFGKITQPVDRFDKAIYTVIGSGVSFSVFVISYSLYRGTSLRSLTDMNLNVIQLALSYLFIILISLIIGVITGLIINYGIKRGEDIRSETAWQIISEDRKEPAKIRAVMNNGHEIWGEILISDSEPHGQDLFLKYPLMVVRDDSGDIINELQVGEYVFLSQTDISHIYYHTEIEI